MIAPTTVILQIAKVGCLCSLVALTGCGEQQLPGSLPTQDELPYVTAREFSEHIAESQLPVLVEFSVPTGCHRCQQMRDQFESLTTDVEGKVQVCRLDFNFERNLVAELGITVCPTYVAFDQGKEVFRVAFPTSGDMLIAKLDEMISTP